MTQEQNAELQKFIKYYNDEKEYELAIREMFDYTYTADKNSDATIKKKALSKTIQYIQDCYNVNPDKMNKLFVSSSITSLLVGTIVGASTRAVTNEVLSNETSTALSIAAGVGTTLLAEYVVYRNNKLLKKYDENIQKAAQMEKAIRDYHKQDKASTYEDIIMVNDTKTR